MVSSLLFVCLFVCMVTDPWIFMSHLGYNPILPYFDAYIVPISHWETFSWFLCPSDTVSVFLLLLFCFVLFCFQHCLPGTTRCSRLILCISFRSPTISHFSKKPYFLSWRMVAETKIREPGVLAATGFRFF